MKINREKILVGLLVVIALIVIGFKFIYTPLLERKMELEESLDSLGNYNSNVENMQGQEAVVRDQLAGLDATIESLKNGEDSESINIQDFLLYISNKTKEYGVDIKKFKDLGVKEDNGIWRATFDIELYGYLEDLIDINQSIDNLGVSHNIKSVSLRQDGEVSYLNRAHKDIVDLTWFETVEEPKDRLEDVGVFPNELPVIVEEIEDEETETITVISGDSGPENIQDQLEILLGISQPKPRTETKVVKKPVKKTVVKGTENTPIISNIEGTIRKEDDFRKVKLNMDFTIEFIMFNDPKYNYSYKELFSTETTERDFVVDDDGKIINYAELTEILREDKDFLSKEIDRVMKLISSEEVLKFETELKDYLNYLLGRR